MRNFLSRKEADELGDALVQQYIGNHKELVWLPASFLSCRELHPISLSLSPILSTRPIIQALTSAFFRTE